MPIADSQMDSDLDPKSRMRQYLQLVATGPELSKSLNQAQAEDAMALILQGEIDSVQTALFLIALRMKRETEAENLGVLDALIKRTKTRQIKNNSVLAIADPFNGYLRSMPATAFLPAVFAACGLPGYIHGLQTVGPKYGITAKMVLHAAGVNVDLNVDQGSGSLENNDLGWCYLDQKHYIPCLHDLVELRDTMVKRSCISTLEVVLKPLYGAASTFLMTGFVHKAYPPVYAALARHVGFSSAAIIRGVEGGCVPSLSQVSRYFGYQGEGELILNKLSPQEISIQQEQRGVVIPDEFNQDLQSTSFDNAHVLNNLAANVAEHGVDALNNKPGAMRDSLIYAASIGLTQFGIASDLQESANLARKAIASGEALERFIAARVTAEILN